MQLDWTIILNAVSTAVLTSGLFFGLIKKYPIVGRAALYVGEHAAELVQGVEYIGKEIFSTPAGAIAANSLHAEVDRVTEDFKKSEIARMALIGLHSFGQASANLSDTQKVALEQFIINSVPKEWGIDSQTITGYLQEAEKAVEAFSKLGLVQAANVFTDAQKASITPVTPDTITTSQTEPAVSA
jgi:hypothetical protein